jgi:1D-myo-inositol-triphosphate 3-kinase
MQAFAMTAGGHATGLYEEKMSTGDDLSSVLLKPLDAAELEVYERLANTYSGDAVHGFVPGFHGVYQEETDNSKQFLRLGNLLHGFSQPRVMDVKLGKRTFLHKETKNMKPRADLFQKMLKHGLASELTSDELEAEAVTKSRYMSCRDANSTTGMFGFRVNGTAGCAAEADGSEEAADAAFRMFAKKAATQKEHTPALIAQKLVDELSRFRSALDASPFVRQHECVGTSALLVADAESGHCRVFWIDFAKTCVCKCEQGLTHREALSTGTQEEGLLAGVDNLITAWASVAQCLSEETLPEVMDTDEPHQIASGIRSLL